MQVDGAAGAMWMSTRREAQALGCPGQSSHVPGRGEVMSWRRRRMSWRRRRMSCSACPASCAPWSHVLDAWSRVLHVIAASWNGSVPVPAPVPNVLMSLPQVHAGGSCVLTAPAAPVGASVVSWEVRAGPGQCRPSELLPQFCRR
jgi:hypothetical protein